MKPFDTVRDWWNNGWKAEISAECPPNCGDCPAFKAIEVYNQERAGRNSRVRVYLAHSAIGFYDHMHRGDTPVELRKLGEQAFALMADDAIVDPNCSGPTMYYPPDDTIEYGCNGVIIAQSRAERFGLEE